MYIIIDQTPFCGIMGTNLLHCFYIYTIIKRPRLFVIFLIYVLYVLIVFFLTFFN
jgi:hypothetical protein